MVEEAGIRRLEEDPAEDLLVRLLLGGRISCNLQAVERLRHTEEWGQVQRRLLEDCRKNFMELLAQTDERKIVQTVMELRARVDLLKWAMRKPTNEPEGGENASRG